MFVKLRYSQWSFYYTKWFVEEVAHFSYIVALYFLAVYIGGGSLVSEYGGNYAAFLVLGNIANNLFGLLQEMPYSRIHEAYYGSLQMYLLSPIGVWSYLLGSVVWILIYMTVFNFLLSLGLAHYILGIEFLLPDDPLALSLVVTFSILSMIGLSFISCSTFSLLNAKGYSNPVRFFTFFFQGILAGEYFPITLLPEFLQTVGKLLPHYYAYRSLRLILLTNTTLRNPVIASDIVALMVFSLVLIAVGTILFELSLRKAKKDGNLSMWV